MSAAVTIAVVSWNTRDLLRRCLDSMAGEAASGRCEVWVIDNASSDGSAAMVREEFGWARLIESEENLGFGPAVNAIARRASADWIAPANADVALTDGALDELLAAAEPGVGTLAPRLALDDGSTQHSVHAFPGLRLGLLFLLGAYRLPRVGDRLCVEGYWRADRARVVDWAHGAFLLVRREAFDAVGGFDDAQWMYAEDIDLQWRLARAGWSVRYVPTARVRHAHSAAAIQAFGDSRTERHLFATYEWMARRRGRTVARTAALLNAAGSALRWLGLAVAAAVAPRRFAPSRRRFAQYTRGHLAGLRAAGRAGARASRDPA